MYSYGTVGHKLNVFVMIMLFIVSIAEVNGSLLTRTAQKKLLVIK